MAEAKNSKEPTEKSTLLTRRDLLKIAGATASAVVVTELAMSGQLSAKAIDSLGEESHGHAGSSEYEWHMAIDLDECIGCHYCVRACQAVNNVADDNMRWNIVFHDRTTDGAEFYMSRPCQHCANAPCVSVCPVAATYIRPDGIVAMDYDKCIGCRYCEVACPYDVRRFNWKQSSEENAYQPKWGEAEIDTRERGVVEKCTFCVQRIDRAIEYGLTPGVDKEVTPACVAVCPVNARIFGNIKDPQSPVSVFLREKQTFRLREDWGTEPKVHYVLPQVKEV